MGAPVCQCPVSYGVAHRKARHHQLMASHRGSRLKRHMHPLAHARGGAVHLVHLAEPLPCDRLSADHPLCLLRQAGSLPASTPSMCLW